MRTTRGGRTFSIRGQDSGMRLLVKKSVIAAMLAGCASAQTGWQRVLGSVNLAGDPRIHVAGPNEASAENWGMRVRNGEILILEGESRLASGLGFRATPQ